MEKEFISYEQALALRELGFDELCFKGYTEEYKTLINFSNTHTNTSVEKTLPTKSFTAPLYQQAFRWLLILVNKDEHFSNKWTISYNEDYFSLFLGGCNMGVFKTELECLKKLIEIVKNK